MLTMRMAVVAGAVCATHATCPVRPTPDPTAAWLTVCAFVNASLYAETEGLATNLGWQ
jgi:hypothetical protein